MTTALGKLERPNDDGKNENAHGLVRAPHHDSMASFIHGTA
jgi:hypothetical protein